MSNKRPAGPRGDRHELTGQTVLRRVLCAVSERRAELNPFDASDPADEFFEKSWRGVVRQRMLLAVVLLALWGVSLQGRLIYLQVVKHDRYRAEALDQQLEPFNPSALRGDILDRHGRPLAYSVRARSIGAFPKKIQDGLKTAASLCAALRDCTAPERQQLQKVLSGRGRFYPVRQARAVSPAQVDRVAALGLPGVVIESESRRYYPGRELAAHLLGFVDLGNKGQAGLEGAYNTVMKGVPGLAYEQVDANQRRLDTHVTREPVPGATLELTIDLEYQHIAERELGAAIEASGAKAGTVVIMNPHTGEVLALANYPSFNPNSPWNQPIDTLRNRATQDVYEPGSTFKIVTAAAAIEEGIVKPTEMIDTAPGYLLIPGRRKAITDVHRYGWLSFEDVIVKSSNVGAVKIGARTGAAKLSAYVSRFGFGERLAPDFIGASRGLWNPTNLGESGLASVSMGYQISVTPLQMAMAASAVANGGLLMEARVVRAVIRDGRREVVTPKVVRRVISAETAAVVTAMMEGVVERGTAKAAQLPGHVVAGKTGTSHKTDGRGYSATDYNASFVGFFPARQPEFTILVMIDTPTRGSHFGGAVAAPVFKKISEALVERAGVRPTVNPQPPVMLQAGGASLPAARFRTAALLPTVVANGGPLMPDVQGLSVRDAIRALQGVGLNVRAAGNGFVARQSPQPGAPIEAGAWGSLELTRHLSAADRIEGRP